MHQLVWSRLALLDRDAIFDYIAADNPRAALAVDRAIQQQSSRLGDFVGLGRPGRMAGTRELVIQSTPYIVYYRVTAGEVLILRVVHGRQRFPSIPS